ncbi:MAG: hypothetical protein AAF471_07145 [Myxococcota bacterium]
MYHKKTVEDIYPEFYLLRVNSFDHETRDNLDEWVYFLKNEKLPENYRARGLKEAAEKLDVLKLSGEERRDYDRYLETLMDRASFYESTYGDGRREERELMAARMLKRGMDPATVAEITGLSLERIEHLAPA